MGGVNKKCIPLAKANSGTPFPDPPPASMAIALLAGEGLGEEILELAKGWLQHRVYIA